MPAYRFPDPDCPAVQMEGVWAGEKPPELADRDGRLVVRVWCQGGFDHTEVDLAELLAWLAANRPDLLTPAPSAPSLTWADYNR